MPHTTLGNFKPERDHDPHSSIDCRVRRQMCLPEWHHQYYHLARTPLTFEFFFISQNLCRDPATVKQNMIRTITIGRDRELGRGQIGQTGMCVCVWGGGGGRGGRCQCVCVCRCLCVSVCVCWCVFLCLPMCQSVCVSVCQCVCV